MARPAATPYRRRRRSHRRRHRLRPLLPDLETTVLIDGIARIRGVRSYRGRSLHPGRHEADTRPRPRQGRGPPDRRCRVGTDVDIPKSSRQEPSAGVASIVEPSLRLFCWASDVVAGHFAGHESPDGAKAPPWFQRGLAQALAPITPGLLVAERIISKLIDAAGWLDGRARLRGRRRLHRRSGARHRPRRARSLAGSPRRRPRRAPRAPAARPRRAGRHSCQLPAQGEGDLQADLPPTSTAGRRSAARSGLRGSRPPGAEAGGPRKG